MLARCRIGIQRSGWWWWGERRWLVCGCRVADSGELELLRVTVTGVVSRSGGAVVWWWTGFTRVCLGKMVLALSGHGERCIRTAFVRVLLWRFGFGKNRGERSLG